jgi:tRNA(fMet)-specific endonuclease VapC
MPEYMLDTDISSYIMKRSNATVLGHLAKVAVADVCISAITHSELLFGIAVSPRKLADQAALDLYLRHVAVLDYPGEASAHYADIRAQLKLQGTPIGANDLFIAAHARCLGLELVTNNTREFQRVPKLQIANWTSAASK